MLSSNRPASFPIPFGKNAAGPFIRSIPVNSQIGVQDGAASLNDGFVPDNFTQIAAGGVPPFGQDMNGILFQATSWDQWVEAGGPIIWDSTFATAIGGYPKGTKLDSAILAGAQWYSTVESNLTNPDDPLTAASWARVGMPVGVPIPFMVSTLPPGFVAMNALTIGGSASNATALADGSALFLYVNLWPNTNLAILTSGGVPTTRGANAVADFLANKQLTLPSAKGTSFKGVDTMGGAASSNLAGVPVVSGNATTPGSIVGGNLQGLIIANLPVVNPAGTITNGAISISQNANSANSNSTTGGGVFNLPSTIAATISASQAPSTFSGTPFGSNTAHNNTDLAMLVFWGLKL